VYYGIQLLIGSLRYITVILLTILHNSELLIGEKVLSFIKVVGIRVTLVTLFCCYFEIITNLLLTCLRKESIFH